MAAFLKGATTSTFGGNPVATAAAKAVIDLIEEKNLIPNEVARQNRLLVGKGGMFGNVIRISPPLNIRKTDVDEFARSLDASLAQCSALHAAAR